MSSRDVHVRQAHVRAEDQQSFLRFSRTHVDFVSTRRDSTPVCARSPEPCRCSAPDPSTMSRPAQKKNHWTTRVHECSVSKDARGDPNVPLRGGAENGEFAYIGPVNEDTVVYKNGTLSEGELLLEVENLSISGLPLYDVQTVIKNCKGPVRLKTVRQGKSARRTPFKMCAFFNVALFSGNITVLEMLCQGFYPHRRKRSSIRRTQTSAIKLKSVSK